MLIQEQKIDSRCTEAPPSESGCTGTMTGQRFGGSFDCPEAEFALHLRLRFDNPTRVVRRPFLRSGPAEKSSTKAHENGYIHSDTEWAAHLARERLTGLLARQQQWYDDRARAESTAEQWLQLCEHHQDQWFHQTRPTHQPPTTNP